MTTRFLLILFALTSSTLAGYDFAVTGDVHHVEVTQNKIILIISGSCQFVNHERNGWTTSEMDHGLIVIARKAQAYAFDQDDWDALSAQARKVSGKKAFIACIDPDSISIERWEVFMVRCRLQSYPAEKKMTTSVWISEAQQPP